MSISSALEVAIVLCGIYVSLSCVCSWINERIAEFLQWRGKTLYEGVLNLVVGEAPLVERIFHHPLIASAQKDADGRISPAKSYRPSYVDARNFSLALWNSLEFAQTSSAAKALDAQAEATVIAVPGVLGGFQARVAALQNADLRDALSALLTAAEGDYQRLLAATDAWFNAQMDRVSGWYKRRVQYVVAGIGLAIVLLFGIDSIEIGRGLYFDAPLRTQLVTTIADRYSKANPNAAPDAGAIAASVDRQLQAGLGGFVHVLSWPRTGSHWLHVGGMALTIVALTLGGPFWFDILACLVNVRGSGPKPQSGGSGSG